MKTFVFDIDTTLVLQNSWVRLHEAAGLTPEEDAAYFTQYKNGSITYTEWIKLLSQAYHTKNQLKQDSAHKTLSTYTLRDNAKDTIVHLQQMGFTIVLITGGFKTTADKIAADLGITYAYASTDISFTDDSTFDYFISQGEEGEAKLSFLKDYCTETNTDMTECFCVGNGYNDRAMFDATGKGITFDWCDEEVQRHATYIVKNIEDILSLPIILV